MFIARSSISSFETPIFFYQRTCSNSFIPLGNTSFRFVSFRFTSFRPLGYGLGLGEAVDLAGEGDGCDRCGCEVTHAYDTIPEADHS